MLVEIGLLGKGLATVEVRALEGPLACVCAKVVEEIVPFAERHVAVIQITLHQAVPSVGPGVLVLDQAETPGLGHEVSVDAVLKEVDRAAWLHNDPDFMGLGVVLAVLV